MIDNSVMYGLRNPAMTQDIGASMMNNMFPVPPCNPMIGMPFMGVQNLGTINNDSFQSLSNAQPKTKKGTSLLKKIAITALVVTGTVFGFKFLGKLAAKKAAGRASGLLNSGLLKNVLGSIKNGVTNLSGKIKKFFKK